MLFNDENLSAITGELVEEAVQAWSEKRGLWLGSTEFIAGKNPAGNLLLFSRTFPANWQVTNIPSVVRYSKNGIKFTWIAEVYVTPDSDYGVIAQELAHLLLGHGTCILILKPTQQLVSIR